MDHHLLRLLWALPLVLAIGWGAMVLLKRLGIGVGPLRREAPTPQVVSTTTLSEHTKALVVEFGQQRWVVFESTAHISVQAEVGPLQ
ncbi:MAG: hypothetical protein V4532_06765 [Pseudomonadota bacterium]